MHEASSIIKVCAFMFDLISFDFQYTVFKETNISPLFTAPYLKIDMNPKREE